MRLSLRSRASSTLRTSSLDTFQRQSIPRSLYVRIWESREDEGLTLHARLQFYGSLALIYLALGIGWGVICYQVRFTDISAK